MRKLLIGSLVSLLMFASCKKVFDSGDEKNYPPVAYFRQSDYTIYLRETIEFNASGSYGRGTDIVKYEWDFDDGIIGFGEIKKHAYNEVGEFYPKLTVIDSKGDSASCYNPLGKNVNVLAK